MNGYRLKIHFKDQNDNKQPMVASESFVKNGKYWWKVIYNPDVSWPQTPVSNWISSITNYKREKNKVKSKKSKRDVKEAANKEVMFSDFVEVSR